MKSGGVGIVFPDGVCFVAWGFAWVVVVADSGWFCVGGFEWRCAGLMVREFAQLDGLVGGSVSSALLRAGLGMPRRCWL